MLMNSRERTFEMQISSPFLQCCLQPSGLRISENASGILCYTVTPTVHKEWKETASSMCSLPEHTAM